MLQGNLIDIEKSGLQEQFPGFLYALIISHSCDIAARSELEPCIELLPCHPIESIDGNKTKAKKPRELHFSIFGGSGILRFAVFAKEKCTIDKSRRIVIVDSFSLCSHQSMLQTWLAARYRRQALDDVINELLHRELKIKNLVGQFSDDISGIWLAYEQLDESKEVEGFTDYAIELYFVFDSTLATCTTRLAEFDGKMKALVQKKKLQMCVTAHCVLDIDISYKEISESVSLNFDYLSICEVE